MTGVHFKATGPHGRGGAAPRAASAAPARRRQRGRREAVSAVLLGTLAGLACGLGLALPDGGGRGALAYALGGVAAGALMAAAVLGGSCALDHRPWHLPAPLARLLAPRPVAHPRRLALVAFAALLLAWAPILAAAYPGFFDYDVGNEWNSQSLQFETGSYNAHHPVLHTLFLGYTMQLGRALTGTYNGGVAVSVTVQAVLVAAILALALRALVDAGMGRVGAAASIAYWAADPVIGLYSFATTKDVLFSAFAFALCVLAYRALRPGRDGGSRRPDAPTCILLGVLAFLLVALRSNGLYAMAVAVPAMAVLAGRGRRVALAAPLAAGTVAAMAFLGPISTAAGVAASPVGTWNALCAPMQQLGYCSSSDAVAPGDRARIDATVPGLEYDPQLSDAVRYQFMHAGASRGELVRLYLDMGARYPLEYLKAYLLLTQDAWNPFAVIDAHTHDAGTTEVIEFDPKEPATRDSKLPALEGALRWIATERGIERVPVLGLGVSIAAYLFVLLAALARAWTRRDRAGAAALMPMLWIAATNLLGPCMLIRYFLYLFHGLPLIMAVLLARDEAEVRTGSGTGARPETRPHRTSR